MQGRQHTYFFYTLIASPKIHTDLLWDLTFIFVVLCGLYFGVIFFFRRKLSLGSKAVRRRKKELSPMISEFLFYDENAPKEEKTNYVNLKIEIRELLNHPANRKVLIDVLMDLRKDLSGTTLSKLFELYEGLGLHHDSYKKLESWRWQRISKGILELTQMHVEESYVFVTKFINDKRSTIRKQAEIAIITLKHEGLNFFLDTTTYRISEWQQLKIMEVLKNKKDYQHPSFKQWLISKNKDVVLFALRLMKHYNQSDGNQALIELLKHKNGEIKVAAIDCIKEFHVVESVETLKLVFWNSSVDIKIATLDAIASLGDNQDIEFLKSVGLKESNFNVKSKALASINAIAPMSVMPTMGIQKVNSFSIPKDIEVENSPVIQSEVTNLEEVDDSHVTTVTTSTEDEAEQEKDLEGEQFAQKSIEEISLIEPEDVIPEEKIRPDISEENENVSNSLAEIDVIVDTETREVKETYSFKMDFLPIVTPKVGEKIVERYRPNGENIYSNRTLLELKVIFEEVMGTSHETKVHDFASKPAVNESEIDFLPIVVPSEMMHEKEIHLEEENKPINVFDIEVVYSEIELKKPKENRMLSELNALVPLPEFSKKLNKENSNVSQEFKRPSSVKNIDMKEIKKIECEGVEVKNEETKNSKIDESVSDLVVSEVVQNFGEQEVQNTLDWVLAENEAQGELKQKIKSIVANQEDIGFKLPKPIFYTEQEANTIALLDDIEAFGDKREVPLLKNMLLEQDELSLRERIQFLIEQITDTSVLKREVASEDTEVFSVFEEFFLRVDVPSQLILLDEIVILGDEKEIPFLKRLVNDSNKKLKKKASICLEQLTTRLSKETKSTDNVDPIPEITENSNEIMLQEPKNITEKPFSIFDVDFDLSLDAQEELEDKSKS